MRTVSFTAFSDPDFDAYLERKWRSNAFNRERLEVKQKMSALGRMVASRLCLPDGTPLSHDLSVEYPALWNQQRVTCQDLFFCRDEKGRRELDGLISRKRTMAALVEDPSPLRNHIFLSVRLDQTGVEVGLKLHADAVIDRDNLTRKCQEFLAREKLVSLVRALPEGYRVGPTDDLEQEARAVDEAGLMAMVAALPDSGQWLAACLRFSRDAEVTRGEGFAERLGQELERLLPLYQFAAWHRDNDHLGMRDQLKERAKVRQSKGLQEKDRVRVKKGIFAGKRGEVESVQPRGKIKVRFGTLSIQMKSSEVERY